MFTLFHEPKIDFMAKRHIWVSLSLLLIAASLVIVPLKGIRKGIEFEGGAEVQVKYATTPNVGGIRSLLSRSGFPGAVVTTMGKPEENEIYIRVPLVAGAKDEDIAPSVVTALHAGQGQDAFTLLSRSYIGPAVGKELIRKAAWAIFGSLLGMLTYIAIRFQFQWGLAAVIALMHDSIITLGLFSLFGYEMSLPVIAAFLTLVGYSVNDTVVVFDRIRENLHAKGGSVSNLPDLINHSINQTLSRTVLTSFLTWVVVLSVFLLGGPALRDFSFVLVVGIIVGTYSSIYIAAPILVIWQTWIQSRTKVKGGAPQQPSKPAKPAAKKVRAAKV
jgi:preprotein translocase subunit SecF